MAFLRSLRNVGDTIGDILAQATVGPGYKTKARFLARQQILGLKNQEQDLMTREAEAQSRRMNDVKNLISFATQGTNVSEQAVPTGSVVPPQISESPEGELSAGAASPVVSSQLTADVPGLPSGVTDPQTAELVRRAAEQQATRQYRLDRAKEVNEAALVGSREAQTVLNLARARAAQSGKPLEDEIAQARLELIQAQTSRAQRAPHGRSAYPKLQYGPDGTVMEGTPGERGSWRVVPELQGFRSSVPSFGEDRDLNAANNAISHLMQVRGIFENDPTIVGPLDKTVNYFSRLVGNPNLNAVQASQLLTAVENDIMRTNIGSARTAIEISTLQKMLTGGVLTTDPEFQVRLDGLLNMISDDFSRLSTRRGRTPNAPTAPPRSSAPGAPQLIDLGGGLFEER